MKDFSFKSNKPVCFFDSGIGGLNLLGECVKRIPNKQFVYFADNFNVPYGNYSEEKILILADKIFSEIQQYNPSAAVIACNTVTAVCIEYLRNKYSFPIIGIQPAIKPAAKNCRRCVVLATPATAHSTGICRLVERFGRGVTEVVACDKLAAYIENNVFDLKIEKIFDVLPDIKAESIVLGCTHYIYIKQIIEKKYSCSVFDGMCGTAERLCSVLNNIEECETDNIENESKLLKKTELYLPKVIFKGGDEWKNKRVFKEVVMSR